MGMRRIAWLAGLGLLLGGCGSSTPTAPSSPPNVAGVWEMFQNGMDLKLAVTFQQSDGSLTATFTVNSNGNQYASGTGSVTASRVFTLHEVYPGGSSPGVDAICDYTGAVDNSASTISGRVSCNTGGASFDFRRK